MQVEELYDLTMWIQSEVVDAQIVKKYEQLNSILQVNAQPNQQKQPFEEQKNKLIESLKDVALIELTNGQIEILSEIGIADHIGIEGVSSVEDSLFRNVIDVASAAEKVQKAITDINRGVRWAEETKNLLAEIVNIDEVQEIGDAVMLRVHFTRDAHLTNLTELKSWGKTWYEIGRGIGMAHGQAPEDIQVVGASKGSIIVCLLSAYTIAKTLSSVILDFLKIAEKFYDIKKKALEVRELNLANDQAEKLLEESAQSEKEAGIQAIIDKTIDELGLNRTTEGDKVNELTSAINKLTDFIEKGGEIDFVLPDEGEDENEEGTETDEERESLRVIFKEVRRLEHKIHQLEHKDH